MYANIDDFALLRPRLDVSGEPEAKVPCSSDDFPGDVAATSSRHETQQKTRYRQRSARSHDIAAAFRQKTGNDATSADNRRAQLRHKPPVAARPVGLKKNAGSTSQVLRRPDTLDVTAVTVDQPPPDADPAAATDAADAAAATTVAAAAGSQEPEQVDVDVDHSPRTDSRTNSASSDAEGSGDSSTSGFSSAGSDVNKATEISYENSTVTLGRNIKRQKPAVKPKRTSCFLLNLQCQANVH